MRQKMIRNRILISVFLITVCSCSQMTRMTGLKSVKILKKHIHLESVAILQIDSSWCIMIEKNSMFEQLKMNQASLAKYSGVVISNDTLNIDLKSLNYSKKSEIESLFKKELFNNNGLCYNYRENYFENKLIYEPFHYYYGPLAAGAGWQYRIKGSQIILKRRFRWIS